MPATKNGDNNHNNSHNHDVLMPTGNMAQWFLKTSDRQLV
jgi:hypothetical protein